MPLSKQEQRCVGLTCHYLEERYGGKWSLKQNLDDLHLSKPTPEVVVSNGSKTAAIEVKRLKTDQEYVESLLSNQKYLQPPCGGSYYLCPAIDFRLPMSANLRRLVKREIARVAPTLSPGQKGAIRIPRQGHISLITETGPAFIMCSHSGPYSEIMDRITRRISGKFMLVDEGLEHSFVTQECMTEFEDAVVRACSNRLEGKIGSFHWDEEWELVRNDDRSSDHASDGVWIVACTGAHSVQDSVERSVHTVLANAMRKFSGARWADLQIVVLDTSSGAPASLAAHAVETFESPGKELIDFFLLADGESVSEASELVSALSRAADENARRQRQHIIDSPISELRVQEFRQDYLKGRQQIGAAEKIFKYNDAFSCRNRLSRSASFGFNRLVHKGPFVDGSNWDRLRGWEFAVAEERHLLEKLRTSLARSVKGTRQKLPDLIPREPKAILSAAEKLSALLADRKYHANLIVVAAHLETATLISLNKALSVSGWELPDDLRTNWILGKQADCVVLYLGRESANSIYVVDLARFASLVQYDPQVELQVSQINEITAGSILRDNPGLDRSLLRSMLLLRLYQSYGIWIRDRWAVWTAQFS